MQRFFPICAQTSVLVCSEWNQQLCFDAASSKVWCIVSLEMLFFSPLMLRVVIWMITILKNSSAWGKKHFLLKTKWKLRSIHAQLKKEKKASLIRKSFYFHYYAGIYCWAFSFIIMLMWCWRSTEYSKCTILSAPSYLLHYLLMANAHFSSYLIFNLLLCSKPTLPSRSKRDALWELVHSPYLHCHSAHKFNFRWTISNLSSAVAHKSLSRLRMHSHSHPSQPAFPSNVFINT